MAARVLVVDDEEDFRIIIQDILETAGYAVQLASDGQDGLSKAAQARPESGPCFEPVAYVHTPQRDALLVVLRRTRRTTPVRQTTV